MSWGAVCTCSARASVLHLLTFSHPTGQAVVIADAKLAGYMYTIRRVCFCGYRLCEVQAARAKTANLYSRGILRF